MKKSLVLISVGVLNLVHGLVHLIQFVQSILLFSYSVKHDGHDEGWLDSLMHNPFVSLLWAVIGLVTLVIGIKDYRHHKKCDKHTH